MRVEDLLPMALAEAQAVDPCVAETLLSFCQRAAVVPDKETPTLSIAADGPRFRVRAGPAFCQELVRDRRDALAVVAHELLHAFRGHLDMLPERDPGRRDLQNVALDILVGAIVLSCFVPRGARIFGRLYPADQFPSCLLLPPGDLLAARRGRDPGAARLAGLSHSELANAWQPSETLRPRIEFAVEDHFRELKRRHPGALARLYLDGWLLRQEPQGYWERFLRLMEVEIGKAIGLPPQLVLLGSHGDELEPGDLAGALLPGLGALEAIPERRPPRTIPPKEARRFFAEVRAIAELDPTARTPARRDVEQRGVVLRPGRREVPMLALGVAPLFYRWTSPVDTADAAGLHLYVDVSGSTGQIQSVFLGLAATLGRSLAEPAWAFSCGAPQPLTRADVRAGRFSTRGGTDFGPVVEHAIRRGFRRVLAMTDGMFDVGPALSDRVRRSGLEITFLLDRQWRSPGADEVIAHIAARVIRVPPSLG